MYGSKFEWNDQTGIEIQPSVRLTYEYSPSTVFWSSWSRAVRRPSRAEDDIRLYQLTTDNTGNFGGAGANPALAPYTNKVVGGYLEGTRDLDSEELLAYEVGMRTDFWNNALIILTED